MLIDCKSKGLFMHTVLFWLKNPTSIKDREAFELSIKKFVNTSKYVQSSYVGLPAGTDRTVVDNSYTYSLVVRFKSVEDHNKYQVEPAHKLFIETCKSLWEKVLIYDALEL